MKAADPTLTWESVTAFVEEVSPDESLLLADGLEAAFVGVARQFSKPPVAVYDRDAVLAIFMTRDGMSEDDAFDHLEFNVMGGWHGEQTPLFLTFHPEARRANPR